MLVSLFVWTKSSDDFLYPCIQTGIDNHDGNMIYNIHPSGRDAFVRDMDLAYIQDFDYCHCKLALIRGKYWYG